MTDQWFLPPTIDPVRSAAMIRDRARLRAVAATGLSDAPHRRFDTIAEQVRAKLHTPVALVVLIEVDRQIFPGAAGLPELWQHSRQTALTHSFCQYVVGTNDHLVVRDARRHPLLHTNDAIRDLGVVAYAGTPLTSRDGQVVGVLCAIDNQPREWTSEELADLDALATDCSAALHALSHATATHRPPLPDERSDLPGGDSDTGQDVPARAPGSGGLWSTAGLPSGLVFDGRPPLRTTATFLVSSARLHGEPVAVGVRLVDTSAARRSLHRHIDVARAFDRHRPPVVVGAYRWSDDDRVLILTRAIGDPLRAGPDTVSDLGIEQVRRIIHTAALLSTWRPPGDAVQRWHVDYERSITAHHHAGHLTDDDARRTLALLRRCDDVRTFAHGNLVPHNILQLPSGRLGLLDFGAGGMYLTGLDLATLYLTTAHDPEARRELRDRVTDTDILEPFTVNLMLATARMASHHHPTAPSPVLAHRRNALIRGRRAARHLLTTLTGA
ncbi:GAF domain-containing protein [Dactylosporangium sp. NPDC000521]|uniref:GAF domain-containing protein n=1 Tax=Dactylosporangium sp. NPDC000521 TaxID=3363975 RepID=UPI00367B123C